MFSRRVPLPGAATHRRVFCLDFLKCLDSEFFEYLDFLGMFRLYLNVMIFRNAKTENRFVSPKSLNIRLLEN